MQQLRRRKGKGTRNGGKGGGNGRPANSQHAGRGGSKAQQGSRTMQQKKATSTCRACGQKGHWAGDPECRATSASSTSHPADTLAVVHEAGDSSSEVADCLVISTPTSSSLMEQPVHLAKHAKESTEAPQVTLDCGSNHNIIGVNTVNQIKATRPKVVIRHTTSPVQLSYRFGGGEVEKTQQRVELRLPFLPLGRREVSFSVVHGVASHLPALLGREFLDQTGALIDFKRGLLTVADANDVPHTVSLQNTRQGHLGHALLVEPSAEVTSRQAVRWTKPRQSANLQRWLKALFCFLATYSMVVANGTMTDKQDIVEAKPDSTSTIHLEHPDDLMEIVGTEQDLREGQQMQLLANINYVRHLGGMQPSDLYETVMSTETTVWEASAESHPDVIESAKAHYLRWRQHVRWRESQHERGEVGAPVVHLSVHSNHALASKVPLKPTRSTCHVVLSSEAFRKQLRLLEVLGKQWADESEPFVAVLHVHDETDVDTQVVKQMTRLRKRFAYMRWIVLTTGPVVLPDLLLRKVQVETAGKDGIMYSSFMTSRSQMQHVSWPKMIDMAARAWRSSSSHTDACRILNEHVLPRLAQDTLPLSVSRTNVYNTLDGRIRGVTIGALTVRGRGVSMHTHRFAWLTRLVAKMAQGLPPFLATQLNQQRPGVRVQQHTDLRNAGDSYVMCFGEYGGGVLTVQRNGQWEPCSARYVWHRIPKGAQHFVTMVTNGCRYSITLYVPTGSEKLPGTVTRRLAANEFPVRLWRLANQSSVYAADGDGELGEQEADDDPWRMADQTAPDYFRPGDGDVPRVDDQQQESWDYNLGEEMNNDPEVGPEGDTDLPNWARAYPRRGKKVQNTEDPPGDNAPITRELRQAAKRLHEDLGHPSTQKLVAALRTHGASSALLLQWNTHALDVLADKGRLPLSRQSYPSRSISTMLCT
eukprot:3214059-Amphidinium_carterae.1